MPMGTPAAAREAATDRPTDLRACALPPACTRRRAGSRRRTAAWAEAAAAARRRCRAWRRAREGRRTAGCPSWGWWAGRGRPAATATPHTHHKRRRPTSLTQPIATARSWGVPSASTCLHECGQMWLELEAHGGLQRLTVHAARLHTPATHTATPSAQTAPRP